MNDRGMRRSTLVVLGVYLVLAAGGVWVQREQINPDAIAYMRLAKALGEGNVLYSVSSNLSPMIIWCAAPLTAAGVDGQLAMRIVLAGWGGVFLIGVGMLLGRFSTMPRGWKILILLSAVPVALNWALRLISTDIALAACLMIFLSCTLREDLLRRRSAQLACGFWGGMAFLAKASALPFVTLILPVAVLLRWWLDRGEAAKSAAAEGSAARASGRKAASAWIVCALAFAVVLAPWLTLLSYKMGRPTFTTGWAGVHAYDPWPGSPKPGGLLMPKPGRITVWEHPEDVRIPDWSPFASSTLAVHQAKVVGRNIALIRGYIGNFDVACASLFALGAMPVAFFLFRRRREDLYRAVWVSAVFVIWCSDYLLVHVESRYIAPILWPIACAWCFHLGWLLVERVQTDWGDRPRLARRFRLVMAGWLVFLFGATAIGHVAPLAVKRPYSQYRAIGHELLQAGCEGPVAGTLANDTLFFAYHMNRPSLGSPASERAEECAAELDRFGARTFFVWEKSPLAQTFSGVPGWVRVTTIDPSRTETREVVQVYRRTSP